MISLIEFEHDGLVTVEEAKEWGIYKGVDKELTSSMVGIYQDRIIAKTGNHRTKGVDCHRPDGDESDNWVDSEGNPIVYYYLLSPVPDHLKDTIFMSVSGKHMVDLEDFALKCTRPFKIMKSIHPTTNVPGSTLQLLRKIEQKSKNLKAQIDAMNTFNEKCNVSIAGGLLTTFNRVMLLEDACTDLLQDSLDNGWRIIAACVQPDQRRPDYMLGRYESNYDNSGKSGAKRSVDINEE